MIHSIFGLFHAFLVATLLMKGGRTLAEDVQVKLPDGERFTWTEEPVVATSATRAEVVLNGLWLFQPAIDEQPKAPWAAIRVPGSWESQNEWGNMRLPSFVGTPPAWTGASFRTEKHSQNLYLEQTARAWYQREITIPKEWTERNVILTFERVSTDAEIFINGKKSGEIHWPGGDVDLTSVVTPGSTVTLLVRVTAVASEKELVIAMREDYADKGNSGLRQRGIIGDVILRSRPLGAHLESPAIETSVSKKEVTISTAVLDLKSPTHGKLTATVTEWPTGSVAETFTAEVEIEPSQPIVLKWPWLAPKLWDIGQPNLYTLKLKVETPGMMDEVTERFGFREFKIEGRNLYLNGTPFFGRINHAAADLIGGFKEAADAETRRMLSMGYNLLEIWPNDTYRRGFGDFRAAYARSADESGILLIMPLIRTDELFSWETVPTKELHQRWLDANGHFVSEVRNDPSIIGYLFSGNAFMTADDQNPMRIGNKQALAQSQQQDVSHALGFIEELRKLDPTRWFGSHSGAGVGDVQTCNHYLGLTPLQEREETLSQWTKTGDMPFGAVEFCSPFSADMHRARMSWNSDSEALATEFMAGILGPRAYEKETALYRESLRERFDVSKGRFVRGPGGLTAGELGYEKYPPYLDFIAPQIEKLWRSWRTYGISLGMLQWENLFNNNVAGNSKLPPFQPGRRGCYSPTLPSKTLAVSLTNPPISDSSSATYLKSIQPLMAYLGGPLDASDGWVAKDHHFIAGQTVRKSIVLINDGRTAQPYTVGWQASDKAGNRLHANTVTGTLGVGEKAFLPVEFSAPDVDDKTDLKITMTASFDGSDSSENPVTLADNAVVRVLPVLPALEKATPIAIFDPEGRTTAMLRHAGFSPTSWTGGPVPDGTVLVIGRRAMSDPEFNLKAFQSTILNGTHAVLFAQDPILLRERAGIRVHQWINRQFWPVETQKDHPLITRLDENDFRDWTGSGSLIAPRNTDNLKESAQRRGYPVYGFRVGARGSVSSAAWEKPHRSGWTPLLEGEFDMAYSPLMELRHGKGYLLSCSLDLEDRAEPLEEVLARRVIQSAASAKVEPRRDVFYTGDDRTAAWLKSSSLVFSKLEEAPPAGSLVIAGPGSALKQAQIDALLAAGTHVFLLGQTSEMLPLGIVAKVAGYGPISPDPLPAWPELRGLSSSELRLRTDIELPLIQSSSLVETAANGLLARVQSGPGVMLVFQGNPLSLDSAVNQYFRFSEWRWTRAISQILTNMGASFSADDILFALKPDPFVPLDLVGEWKLLSETTFPPAPSVAEATIDPGPKSLDPAKPDFDDSKWSKIQLPAMNQIGDINWHTSDGSIWVRRKILIPADWRNQGDASLVLGSMDDHDNTYFNGIRVGSVGKANGEAWNTPRSYRIPEWLIQAGKENTVAIRLFDQYGGGGFGANGGPLSMRLELRRKPERASVYVPGFRTDKAMGDDPARYTRW